MAGKTQAEGKLTRYLLGTLSESEREGIESEYLSDEDAFEQILIAEDELVDAYARDELSAKERKQFEEKFLNSPSGQERVLFARTLAEAVSGARPVNAPAIAAKSRSPGFVATLWAGLTRWRLAGVAVAVALIVGFLWLLADRASMRRQLQALHAQNERLSQKSEELQRSADAERVRNTELAAQLQTEKERQQAIKSEQGQKNVSQNWYVADNCRVQSGAVPGVDLNTQEFSLTSGSTRGGGGHTLKLRNNAKLILLRLNLETEASHEGYRASIETAEGRVVKSIDVWKPQSNRNTIVLPAIPAADLQPGDYILSLTGKRADGTFDPVASYSFRIRRR